MTKIFAKYLPVEDDGSVDRNQQCIFKINGKWTEPRDWDSMIGPQIEEVKFVNLFLCSVVKGDSDSFKMLGHISKGARWIKEGDVFKEGAYCPIHNHHPETEAMIYVNELEEPVEIPIYKFECPSCKHWH